MSHHLQIELSAVEKYYGSYHALKNINLAIPEGAFVALVGPSGCGKSTLLRSLAGLESISSGTMKIKDQIVNKVPPRKRDVAMVFQSYALYPHMKVVDNLTYSMRLKKISKEDCLKAAQEVASSIGLENLLDRYPRELSGGQRQRVAMGRAIIRRPKVFLFDEPLSNLDASLRVHMRKEIRALHDRLHATSVYVTHDQIEAMTMADYVVVLRDGRIEQQGAPLALYDRPVSQFVAGFIGSPAMNFVRGTIDQTGRAVILDLPNNTTLTLNQNVAAGREVIVGLRPEHLVIEPNGEGSIHLPVKVVETTGSTTYITAGEQVDIAAVVAYRLGIKAGENISLSIDAKHIHLFDPESKEAII